MARRYYSSREKRQNLTIEDLYNRLQYLYLFFRDKDYFKRKVQITSTNSSNEIEYKAALSIGYQLLSIDEREFFDVTEDHIFDVIEFLVDNVSKPIGWEAKTTDTGFNYYDYEYYDDTEGQVEFRKKVNHFLIDYKTGFKLTKDGLILALGTDGLESILDAEIEPYDDINVDKKVKEAIQKWRNRNLNMNEEGKPSVNLPMCLSS